MNSNDVLSLEICGLSKSHISFIETVRAVQRHERLETLQQLDLERAKLRHDLAVRLRKARGRANKAMQRAYALEALRLSKSFKEAVHKEVSRHLDYYRSECLNLALRIASAIMRANIQHSSETLCQLIQDALEGVVLDSTPLMLVSQADYLELRDSLSKIGKVRIEDSLSRGKAKIVLSSGEVTIDWEVELSQIEQELRGKM